MKCQHSSGAQHRARVNILPVRSTALVLLEIPMREWVAKIRAKEDKFMSNEPLQPPVHLEPFTDGTPLAIERLRCAWSGLVLSDRIYLLSVLLADRNSHPFALVWKRQHEAVIDLALEDENPYIRYLAAKRVPGPDKRDTPEVKARAEKIKADASQLVRSAQQEVGTIQPPFRMAGHGLMDAISPTYDPARFWTAPQVHRLAIATWSSWDFSVAEPLRYATKELLPNGTVTENEMADVLLQNLGPAYKRRLSTKEPRPGRSPYHFDQEIEEFWKLVPDLPKQLAGILLECLPGGDKRSPIPPDVLDSLDEENLAFLLRRDDVELKVLRRKLYADSASEKLRRSAIASTMFGLLDSDISRLVSNLDEHGDGRLKDVEELTFLARHCRGASLVQMECTQHYLCHWKTDYYRTDESDALQSERAKRLWSGGSGRLALGEEVLQLRVFELAKLLSPLDFGDTPSVLPKSLKQHQKLVILRNPWQTYLNLWGTVRPAEWTAIEEDLPNVWIRNFDMPS
jgi:hypothetical protein